MRRFLSLLVTLLVLGSGALYAQTKQVSGKVLSAEDNKPIPGVSVFVKEVSSIGTSTNIDGLFTIKNVPANAKTLVFRFVGFQTQEVAIKGGDITVILNPETQKIEEVVVTAMGMKRDKKALGYASQDLKASDLTKAGNSNVATSLQGKVSGIDIKPSSGMPGASTNITIRGARSFSGNNAPLYVVDGMPIASDADMSTGSSTSGANSATRSLDLDPNEIESMNILKGQAAAALYGIRASNGVVIITTKSGKGIAKGKPVITYNNGTSWDVISRYPDLQNTYAQGTLGKYGPSSSQSWGPRVEDLPKDAKYGGDANGHPGKYFVPQLNSVGDPNIDPWVTPQKYNNVKDFFQVGMTENNSFNLSQSLDNANYSFGFGNTNQSGIVPSTSMNKYNARALAEIKLGKEWKTGFSANFVTSKVNKAPSANDGILACVIPAPIQYNLKGYPTHTLTDPYSQINYRGVTVFNNPYWASDNNEFTERNDRFFGNTFIEYNPQINWGADKNLVLRYQAGIDSYTTHYQDIFEFGTKAGAGNIDNYGVTKTVFNSLLTANFNWNIKEDLQLNVVLGNEINNEQIKSYDQTGLNFNFGGWKNIANTTVLSSSEAKNKDRNVGFFGNLALSYKNMVYLNITGRNDYVSTMPRNNRSFFYPSISASWILTELEALKGNKAVNFFKVRASYAQVGQAGVYKDNYYAKPSYGGGFWNNPPISYPVSGVNAYIFNTTLYDPNLKPQNTVSYEGGFDMKMFNNIVSLEYTYSRQNVTDQIFDVPLAGSSGAAAKRMNGGKIHTNSHEVILNFRLLSTKDMEWNLGGNFTKIDNYVDELAPGVESIFLGGFTTPQVRAGIGYKFPVIYGSMYARDDQGHILVDENTKSPTYGLPMAGKPGVIGNCAPDFILGGNTNFRWKSIVVSATLSWQKGGQMYSGTNELLEFYGMSKVTEDRTSEFIYPGYKANGQPNDIKRGGASDKNGAWALYNQSLGNINEAAIYDMDFVKLREVTLGYTLPKIIKGVNINVTGYARNILIWTKLPNLDPEASQGNNNMGGYFERFSLPQTTSYGFGVNLTF